MKGPDGIHICHTESKNDIISIDKESANEQRAKNGTKYQFFYVHKTLHNLVKIAMSFFYRFLSDEKMIINICFPKFCCLRILIFEDNV